ncbi:MAG: TlpA disulfide reductase family protein [Verrucomicrobia bacterium]|nr:TlpA disulfide reductase family protein [Verrucomicrobiota bacterium]
MSHRLLLLILLGLLWHPPARAEVKLATLKVGDTVYSDVTVVDVSATDILLKHNAGVSNIKLRHLSPELQKQFHYDAERAEKAERQQDLDTALYQRAASQRAWEHYLAQKAAAETAPDSDASQTFKLTDPLNDNSPLNKRCPSLGLTDWYSEKPAEPANRPMLIFFWNSQSEPCRRAIPDVNNWQAKFATDLTVIGVTTETAAQVRKMTQPEIKFSHAGDVQASFAQAVGVTSVPAVLLVDQAGIIRYQGHPAAINDSVIEQFIGHPATPAK